MGFFFHPLFQRDVKVLQLIGHLVESLGQFAEFVPLGELQTHTEIRLAHALNTLTQTGDWTHHHQRKQTHQKHRADKRQTYQPDLEGVQQHGGAGIAGFHHLYQVIHVTNKTFHGRPELRQHFFLFHPLCGIEYAPDAWLDIGLPCLAQFAHLNAHILVLG